MNIRDTGNTMLFDTMTVIEKLDAADKKAFEKESNKKRENPLYWQLFLFLYKKHQSGVSPEELRIEDVKEWAEGKTKNVYDTIDLLYNELIQYIGKKFAKSEQATWHRQAHAMMDQVEGLYPLGLRKHAEIILKKLDAMFTENAPPFRYQWNETVSRLVMLRQSIAQRDTPDQIAWTNDMNRLARMLTESYHYGFRKLSEVKQEELEKNTKWQRETIFLRVIQLHAEFFRDKEKELQNIQSLIPRSAGRLLRALQRRDQAGKEVIRDKTAQEETLDHIESMLIRLYGYQRAIELAQPYKANDFLNFDDQNVISGTTFYPASSMWVLDQLQSLKLAHAIHYKTQPPTVKSQLHGLQREMERKVTDLPLRLELYQILVLYGNGKFHEALDRIQKLLKAKKESTSFADLRMMEVLAMTDTNDKTRDQRADSLRSIAANKKEPEWVFVRAYAALMVKMWFIGHNSSSIVHNMKDLVSLTQPIKDMANPYDPVHQLILWRIHGWESGESSGKVEQLWGLDDSGSL
jgi:hypothetical protein